MAKNEEIKNEVLVEDTGQITDPPITTTEGKSNNDRNIPTLFDWMPVEDELIFMSVGEVVKASFEKIFNVKREDFNTFYIKKAHFKKKMPFIVHHINYFLKFYDIDGDFLLSLASVKFIIDSDAYLSESSFNKTIQSRIITDKFVKRICDMTNDLYTININSDQGGKFKSTPKITNDQAKVLVSISFAMKIIFPLLVHYSNTNRNLVGKKDYIKTFDDIFMDIIHRFERDTEEEVFIPLCKFIKYRIEKWYMKDRDIWAMKKQLYGLNYETYLQELIHEIIIVKGLYKLEYNKSIVSFIDGVTFKSYSNFKKENFPYKPIELSAENDGNDSDEYLSRAEAQEMLVYRIDESNLILNDVNNQWVMKNIRKNKFKFDIPEEDLKFYIENCSLNSMNQFFLQSFYAKYFRSSSALYSINKEDTIKLLIYEKMYLQSKGFAIIPQLCTAVVKGKYNDNLIRNSKFIEKLQSSTAYQRIIKKKFKYILDLDTKEDIIIKKLSTIINSSFMIVDTNPEFNGQCINDINNDIIIDEFLTFLTII